MADEPFIKVMGFALATAVFFDAFVVRMTFIPATMFLLDEHAWKFPTWLGKIIPAVDVEGESLVGLEAGAKNDHANQEDDGRPAEALEDGK